MPRTDRLPFFAERIPRAPAGDSATELPTDLLVIGCASLLLEMVCDRIRRAFGGLRLRVLTEDFEAFNASGAERVLQVFEHPTGLVPAGADEAALRSFGADWLRRATRTRQLSLSPSITYGELRVEDLAGGATSVEDLVRSLLNRSGTRGARAFLVPAASVEGPCRIPDPLATIAGPFARDLGYY
jgi:hypothetical protein